MSTTTDQIERMAKEISILKFNEELEDCKSLEDLDELKKKYAALAKEIVLMRGN
ncbi:MAG: hypothetical protein IJ679_03810 [Lachnospiraceae bacterium]|nr:hypothetical protein [Lachnospiraceae bacterium]